MVFQSSFMLTTVILGFPFRTLGRERLHPIECEEELEIHRLLAPECAVIVKGRDPLVRRNKTAEPSFVTLLTNSVIDCLALPSFHEGNGSCALVMAEMARTVATKASVLPRGFIFR
jgi:hypothetical protein